jgi:hypothetical protein
MGREAVLSGATAEFGQFGFVVGLDGARCAGR